MMIFKNRFSILAMGLFIYSSMTFADNILTLENFLKITPKRESPLFKDTYQEAYSGVTIEDVVHDVEVKNCSKLPFLNESIDRKELFDLLKEAKNHIEKGKRYPLSFDDKNLWDFEATNDFAAFIDNENNSWIFQITYIEHLLSVENFRNLVLSTIDSKWEKKKQIEELFKKMVFMRALGQTGILKYSGKDGREYISIGLKHPKGGGLTPSGFLTRLTMTNDSHRLVDTLNEEMAEEVSPLFDLSKIKKNVVGYAFNRVSTENISYYDFRLFEKLLNKNININIKNGISFIRGLLIVVEINEKQSFDILKYTETDPGVDFKKEVGVLQFKTIDEALKILEKGHEGKINAEHIAVLNAYKNSIK